MSVTGNPYGFYPDRTKYPLANLDGQLVPKAHTHPTSQIIGLADEYAAKTHTHPTSQITNLANEYAAKNHTHTPQHLVYLDDAAVQEGNLKITQKDGLYYFEIENNEPTGDSEMDAIIAARVRKELERMHMPEGDMKVIEFDEWPTGTFHSHLYYWLKGGMIVWTCLSHPQFPTNRTIEVKNLGYFEYPDGSPCPFYHTFGHLHYHHMNSHEECVAFLCHPTSWSGAAPWSSVIAMHKRSISGSSGWPGYDEQSSPEGLAMTGSGVFVMTGEHFVNIGTEANPIWQKDRDAWQAGSDA